MRFDEQRDAARRLRRASRCSRSARSGAGRTSWRRPRLALDWRTIDDELAELLHDSSEHAPPGCEARRPARDAELRRGRPASSSRSRARGPSARSPASSCPPAPARIEVRHAGGVTEVEADAQGRFIARGGPGRHREPPLPGRIPRRGHAVASALTDDRSPAALAAEAYRVVVDDPERARALAGEALRTRRARRGRRRRGAPRARHGGAGARRRRHRRRAPRARGPRRPPRRPAARGRGADVLALALLSAGATRRALREADRATRLDGAPDRGALQLQRALILERLGRLDEALDGYRRRSPASAAAGTATARRARSATAACSRPTAASSARRRPTCGARRRCATSSAST